MTRRYTTDEDRYLIRTHRSTPAVEQATHLGRSYGSVRLRRRKLMARGKIATTRRAANRVWSEDEKATVELLIQQGKGVTAIAREIDRAPTAIDDLLHRNGQTIEAMRNRRGARVRAAAEIARLFFVHTHTPPRWIRRGWLQAERNGAHVRHGVSHWLITDTALQAFIDLRESWVAWQPSQIRDPHWRAYAFAARGRANGEWLSIADVAQRYHVGVTTVGHWYASGQMAGIATVRYIHRYFWSADIVGWQPRDRRIKGAAA
jgi:hypothetical protein